MSKRKKFPKEFKLVLRIRINIQVTGNGKFNSLNPLDRPSVFSIYTPEVEICFETSTPDKRQIPQSVS